MADWFARLKRLWPEPEPRPDPTRFDLIVEQRVNEVARRLATGQTHAPEPAPVFRPSPVLQTTAHRPAGDGNFPAAGAKLSLAAHERLPEYFVARQPLEHERRIRELVHYRDRLQALLDMDWARLPREDLLAKANEALGLLNLLESKAAEDPTKLQLKLNPELRKSLEEMIVAVKARR